MSAEDRLREILRSEAQTVTPTGDGLTRIQARVARRRRLRIWMIPSAAVATAGAVLAFFVLAPSDKTTQTLVPGITPTPSAPATSTPAPVPADSYTGPAVWPLTSQAAAESWDLSGQPWVQDGLEVGRRFVKDHLGLSDVTVRQDCVSCEALAVVADGRDVGTLDLAHYSAQGKRLFTIVQVEGTDLEVSTPSQGASVSSPLSVAGTIEGVDESIVLRLLDEGGQQLAQGTAAAGSGAPWRTSLAWSDRTWTHGALVLRTGNLRDGATNRLVVLAVTRGTAPAGPTFVGLVDGHVSEYAATTGALVRQLTFPPAGKTDVEAAWAGGTVLWVRQGDGSCGGEVNLRTPDGTSTVGPSKQLVYTAPELSGDGRWMGWVQRACLDEAGGWTAVVLPRTGAEGTARRLEGPTGSELQILDIAADGALLVLTNDLEASGPGAIGLVRAGATTLDGLTPITPEPGCYLTDAAFDENRVVGFQACEDGIQLVRWSFDGKVSGKDKAMNDENPASISVRHGLVLVQRFGGDVVGPIARYSDGRFTDLVTPDPQRCSSTADLRGCVTSPDW